MATRTGRRSKVFADSETNDVRNPLLPGGRRAYEYSLCRRRPDGEEFWLDGFIDLKDLPWDPDDPALDRTGLDIGRFYWRHPQINPAAKGEVYREADMAALIDQLFRESGPGKPYLIGIVPQFDELNMIDLLHRHDLLGRDVPWDYHSLCAKTYLGGRMREEPPWDARRMARRVGVDISAYAAHTARGDAELARDLYDAARRPAPLRWLAAARLSARRFARAA